MVVGGGGIYAALPISLQAVSKGNLNSQKPIVGSAGSCAAVEAGKCICTSFLLFPQVNDWKLKSYLSGGTSTALHMPQSS